MSSDLDVMKYEYDKLKKEKEIENGIKVLEKCCRLYNWY